VTLPVIVKRGRFLRTVVDGEERLGLAEMVAKTHPNDCVFCGERRRVSGKGRPDITCGDKEICGMSYHRFWRRDQRAAQVWALKQPARTTRYNRRAR
jgi:hypothetical protein